MSNSQNQGLAENGWATFFNEAAMFSESFRKEMSDQLHLKLFEILGVEADSSRAGFFLHVGDSGLEISVREKTAFIKVSLISYDSIGYGCTVFWELQQTDSPEKATSMSELDSQRIAFGWCNDLNAELFKKMLRPLKILNSKKHGVKFRVEYDYSLFPDLQIQIYFSVIPENILLNNLEKLFRDAIPGSYVSGFSLSEHKAIGIIDFQGYGFKEGIAALLSSIKLIGDSNLGGNIERIVIR